MEGGVWREECGERSVERGVWREECGERIALLLSVIHRTVIRQGHSPSTLLPPHSSHHTPHTFHKLSHSFSHIALDASLGMRQSPRGLRLTLPTLGPSGRQERLNCWLKKRRQKTVSQCLIVSSS